MATLQDVEDAIAARAAAITAKATALAALDAASTAAFADITNETATFVAAQTVYNAAVNTANDNHDVPALLSAFNAAELAETASLYTMRDVMKEFADSIV